uniref:Uncharacterized protein n=1 Tax=Panagrellus redivivus TaxID=6233 RepID=A0A7E4UP07_PANRE
MDHLPGLVVVFGLCLLVGAVSGQSVLFPHGYFDMNKLTAVDAFYLNMLAISTLENSGITEKELDDLAESRKVPAPPGSLQAMIEKAGNATTADDDDDSDEFEPLHEKPLTPGDRPRAPFKRVRREDDDDDFNPFEDIATRAPSTVAPQRQRLLNRNQILGVSSARPRQHVGIPHEGEMPKQGWMHPRRRKPYIDIDWSKPQIVELPLPPDA